MKISKFTYWKVAYRGHYSVSYSERFRSKKEAMKFWNGLKKVDPSWWIGSDEHRKDENGSSFEAPEKCVIEYTGGIFGVLEEIFGENLCNY